MELLIKASQVAGAILVIGGFAWNICLNFMKFKMYDKRIKALTAEQCLQTRVLDAILDGLEQLGCNHSVPDARKDVGAFRDVLTAKKELNDFLRERAHEVNEL